MEIKEISCISIGSRPVSKIEIGKAVPYEGLCFTAEDDNVSVVFTNAAGEYKIAVDDYGKHWTSYELGSDVPLRKGLKVYFAAKDANDTCWNVVANAKFWIINEKGLPIGRAKASGSILSLLDADCKRDDVPESCYYAMFSGTCLTQAPELPATSLASCCYLYMFYGCPSLTGNAVICAEAFEPSLSAELSAFVESRGLSSCTFTAHQVPHLAHMFDGSDSSKFTTLRFPNLLMSQVKDSISCISSCIENETRFNGLSIECADGAFMPSEIAQ